jgi:Domain of unknown function (DUF4145)
MREIIRQGFIESDHESYYSPQLHEGNIYYCDKCNMSIAFIEVGVRHTKKYPLPKPRPIQDEVVEKVINEYNELVVKKSHQERTRELDEYEVVFELIVCPRCIEEGLLKKYTLINGVLDGKIIIVPNIADWHLKANENTLLCLKDKQNIIELYSEFIYAINTQMALSAGALARLIIETICRDKGIDGQLIDKINSLPLDETYKETLHLVRDIGNKTVHHGYATCLEEIKTVKETIDFTIFSLYSNEFMAARKNALALHKSTRR